MERFLLSMNCPACGLAQTRQMRVQRVRRKKGWHCLGCKKYATRARWRAVEVRRWGDPGPEEVRA